MIILTVWDIIIVAMTVLAGVGLLLVAVIARRRPKARHDDASRFDAGDIITLTDGSSMRVVSTSAPNGCSAPKETP